MDAPFKRGQFVAQTCTHHTQTEVEKVPEDVVQAQAIGFADRRVFGRDQARKIDWEVGLQRRMFEQVRHHHPFVGIAFNLQRNPHIVG